MRGPQLTLDQHVSVRADTRVNFLYRFPARFEQRNCNRVSVALRGLKTVLDVGVDHRIFVDRGIKLHAPSNLKARLKHSGTDLRFKLPELNAVAYELNFTQLTDEASFLNVVFLGRMHSRCNVQTPNCSFRHLHKVSRGNLSIALRDMLSAVGYPYCDPDSSYCPDGLHPRCRIWGAQCIDHIGYAEGQMQKCTQQKECYEAENGPVEGLEIFSHQLGLASCSAAIVCDALVVAPEGFA